MNQTVKICGFIMLLLAATTAFAQNKTTKEYQMQVVGYDEAITHSVDVVTSAHITPIVADLNVQQTRITHKEVFANNIRQIDVEHPRSEGSEISYIKNYTLTRAAKKYNADVIVAPTFEVSTSEDNKTVTVEVTGYPASYSNFRKATNADLDLIEHGYTTSRLTPSTKKSTSTRNELD